MRIISPPCIKNRRQKTLDLIVGEVSSTPIKVFVAHKILWLGVMVAHEILALVVEVQTL